MTPLDDMELDRLLRQAERAHRRVRILSILAIICSVIAVATSVCTWWLRNAADRPAPPVVPVTQVHQDHSAS